MRQRIYVAGPISIGDRQKNVQQALEAGQKLVEMGYAPLVPHLSCFWEDRGYSIPHEKWLEIDLPWVEVCDALLRLPGESKGADAEVQRAKDVGISVYYSLEELQAYPPDEEQTDGHPGFLAALEEIKHLHRAKMKDYGSNADPFANIRATERFGIPAWLGAMIRAADKVSRVQTFAVKGTLANEGVEDSLADLAAYALIALVLFRENESKFAVPANIRKALCSSPTA